MKISLRLLSAAALAHLILSGCVLVPQEPLARPAKSDTDTPIYIQSRAYYAPQPNDSNQYITVVPEKETSARERTPITWSSRELSTLGEDEILSGIEVRIRALEREVARRKLEYSMESDPSLKGKKQDVILPGYATPQSRRSLGSDETLAAAVVDSLRLQRLILERLENLDNRLLTVERSRQRLP